jgi:predicted RNase H-like HicB family nuclease
MPIPVKSIVDDYLFAAMLHAKGTRTEDGTLVLTVPDFPGIIACGADARQAFDELYRLLEDWIQVSLEKGYRLPTVKTDTGMIELNSANAQSLVTYHNSGSATRHDDGDRIFIGDSDDFDAFLSDVGQPK